MAYATRSAQAMKERLLTHMDFQFIELATPLKEVIQDLVKQNTDAKSLNPRQLCTQNVILLLHTSAVLTWPELTFLRFNGDNVIPWIHQCDN